MCQCYKHWHLLCRFSTFTYWQFLQIFLFLEIFLCLDSPRLSVLHCFLFHYSSVTQAKGVVQTLNGTMNKTVASVFEFKDIRVIRWVIEGIHNVNWVMECYHRQKFVAQTLPLVRTEIYFDVCVKCNYTF